MASTSQVPPRDPVPPYTKETALKKVQAAEDAWNTRDPKKIAQAYTIGEARCIGQGSHARDCFWVSALWQLEGLVVLISLFWFGYLGYLD